jgi:hypothetical protein
MTEREINWQGVLDAMDRMKGESVAVTIEDPQGRYLLFMHGWLRGRTPDLDIGDSTPRYRLETGHAAHRFDESCLILYEETFRSARDAGHTLVIYHRDHSTTVVTLNAPLGVPV